jgi:NADH-quinone oxidoreductase subunit J
MIPADWTELIPNLQQIFFLGFAGLAVLCSILMITRRNAVHSALLLVLVFFQLAGMYVLLSAEFLAALQVLVYTGAILVLFLFVIMLLQLREAPRLQQAHRWQRLVAVPLGLILALEMIAIIWFGGITLTGLPHQAPAPATIVEIQQAGGSPRALGQVLYTIFLLPFEVASMILLVAVIGAIVLARREEPAEVERLIPSLGVSLGRRGIVGSPQEEQLEKMMRPDVTTPIAVRGGERAVPAPGLGSTAAGGRAEDEDLSRRT